MFDDEHTLLAVKLSFQNQLNVKHGSEVTMRQRQAYYTVFTLKDGTIVSALLIYLKQYQTRALFTLGRQIRRCMLDNGGVAAYEKLLLYSQQDRSLEEKA